MKKGCFNVIHGLFRGLRPVRQPHLQDKGLNFYPIVRFFHRFFAQYVRQFLGNNKVTVFDDAKLITTGQRIAASAERWV